MRAVFLDRDGTLIEEKDYLQRPEQVKILPSVPEALRLLQEAGFKLFIVTNQSGVGRGFFTMADVERVHEHLCREFDGHGIRFERIFVAPEAPDQPSRGRKPSPQFLFDARDDQGVELARSYMVGDKLIDLECGWNAGVAKSILVQTGYGAKTAQQAGPQIARALVVEDMIGAAKWIMEKEQGA